MFELGTTKHWWDAAKKYPMLSKHENTLKPLGYAQALNFIEENITARFWKLTLGQIQ